MTPKVSISIQRLSLEEMLLKIGPFRENCFRLMHDLRVEPYVGAPGSSHNHQAWPGGYFEHVEEVMNLACLFFPLLDEIRPLPFTLEDALIVLYLHDVEKPWRWLEENKSELKTKEQREVFRQDVLMKYGITLTPAQANAFKYVEGEHKDYSATKRVSNELAAFCHMCDNWSARGWYDFPKKTDDTWTK